MKSPSVSILILVAAVVGGCTSLVLKPAEFGWPVESVVKADARGMVQESRYQVSFNVKPLLFEETGDSTRVSGVTLRMIRDQAGFYYLTASKFKHVYVFQGGEGALKLENKILISEQGMEAPAFNARPPYVQLLNGKDKPRLLSSRGIKEGE